MKLAAGLLIFFASFAGAAVAVAALAVSAVGATGKSVLITNIEERDDGYIIVTFSGLEKFASCAAQHRNTLLFEGKYSASVQVARQAFSLGHAVDVWGSGTCTKLNNYEDMTGINLSK
jgi:hypothetical protein